GLLGDGEGFDLGLDLDDLDEPRQPQRRRENRGAEDQFGSNMDGDETMEVEIGLDTPGTVDRRSAQDLIAPDLGAVDQLNPRASNQNQSEEEIIAKGQPPKKRLRRQLVDLVTELDPADHPSSSLVPNNPSHRELLPKLLEVDGQNWLMAAPIGRRKRSKMFPVNRADGLRALAKGETSKLDIFDEPGNTQPSQSSEAETERNETELLRNQTSGSPNPCQIELDNINLVCKTLDLTIVEMAD
ncbi:hypothetical protein BY996DRAFT_8535909, partial [Phakopsora pachyrhizi]